MAEELIDSLADRAKVGSDKEFMVEALTEIYEKFQSISNLKIQLSGDASFKDVVNTVKQIRGAQDELEKSQLKLAAATSEYNKQVLANRLAIQQANQATKEEILLSQQAEGSLKQKQILLKQLVAQYDALGAAARKSADGDFLLNGIKALTAEVSELEQATGRFQRQVGNYELVGKSIERLRGDIVSVKEEFNSLGGQSVQQLNAGLSNIVSKLKQMEAAGQQNTEEFGALRAKQEQFNAAILNGLKTLNSVKADLASINQQMEILEKNGLKDSEIYKQLDASVKEVTASVEQLGVKNAQNAEGLRHSIGGAVESLKEFGSELVTQAALFIGIYQAYEFFKDAIKEFQQQEEAAAKLNNILKNIGRQDALESVSDSVKGLTEQFRTLKDEDITSVFDKLIVYGKLSENQINTLLPVIINFAAHTGTSLDESAGVVIKAMEGNAKALKTFGINMKDGKDVAERFGIVMDQLAPRVAGAAESFGNTTAGQIKKTEIEIDELKKKIGEELQPAVKGFFEYMSESLKGLAALGKGVADILGKIAFGSHTYYGQLAENQMEAIKEARIKEQEENKKLADFYLDGDKFSGKSKTQQEGLLKVYENAVNSKSAILQRAIDKNDAALAKSYTRQLAVAVEIQARANAIYNGDKTLGLGGDSEADAEKQSRQSLIAEIKAEAEARLKLIEVKGKEQIKELSFVFDSENSPGYARIRALTEANAIEKNIIEERRRIELQSNADEQEDLLLNYQDSLKKKKITAEQIAFLDQKYALQSQTLATNRKVIIENADNDLFEKQVTHTIGIQKIYAQVNQAERDDELLTIKTLTEARELYFKTQEDLIKAAFDKRKGYINEDASFSQEGADRSFGLADATGNSNNFDRDQKLNALRKEQATVSANDSLLKNERDKINALIALDKQKNDFTAQGLATSQDLQAQYADNEKKIEENKYKIGLEYAKKLSDEKKTLKNEEISLAQEVGDTVQKFVDGSFESQLNAIQRQIDKNDKLKEAETSRITNSTLSEQDKAAKLTVLNAQTAASNEALARKQKQIQEKQAQFDRVASITKIVATTAVSVADLSAKEAQASAEAALLAANPYTAAYAPAAVASAASIGAEIGVTIGAGAAQIAAILAQPIPHYASGTLDHPGGSAVVGDAGRSELAILPDGSMVVTPSTPTVMNFPKHTVVMPDADAINKAMLNRMIDRTMSMMGGAEVESTAHEIRELRDEMRYQTLELKKAISKGGKTPNVIIQDREGWHSYIQKSVFE